MVDKEVGRIHRVFQVDVFTLVLDTSFACVRINCKRVCRVIETISDNDDAFLTYRDGVISRTKSDALLFHVRYNERRPEVCRVARLSKTEPLIFRRKISRGENFERKSIINFFNLFVSFCDAQSLVDSRSHSVENITSTTHDARRDR